VSSVAVADVLDAVLASRPNGRVSRDAVRVTQLPGVVEAVVRGNGASARALDFGAARLQTQARTVIEALAAGQVVEASAGDADSQLSPTLTATVRPYVEDELRTRRIVEMERWDQEARGLLASLPATPDAREQTRRLVDAISDNAVELGRQHVARRDWAAARQTAVDALEQRSAIPADVDLSVNPRLHLQAAHALFMQQGNTPELREALTAARQQAPDAVGLAYWDAHYQILAGEYQQAAEAINGHEGDGRVAARLVPILAAVTDSEPEKPHPSNFYSYRESFISDAKLNELAVQIASIMQLEGPPNGLAVPEEWKRAEAAAQAAVAAVAAASAARDEQADRVDLEREVRRARAGNWKFEDSRGDPRVDDTPPAARRAGASGRQGGVASDAAFAALVAEAEQRAREFATVQQQTLQRIKEGAAVAARAVDALLAWDRANVDLRRQKHTSASREYAMCQLAVLAYLKQRYPAEFTGSLPTYQDGVVQELVRVAGRLLATRPYIRAHFSARNAEIALDTLRDIDWVRPIVATRGFQPYDSAVDFLNAWLFRPEKIDEKVDAPLIAIALLFAPMGIAESYRGRRAFDLADQTYAELLKRDAQLALMCTFIETPFVKLMRGQVLLEKGDAQYKSGLRSPQGDPRYGRLVAAGTYLQIEPLFQDALHTGYVDQVEQGAAVLQAGASELLGRIVPGANGLELQGVNLHPLAVEDGAAGVAGLPTVAQRERLSRLGRESPFESVQSRDGGIPGAGRDTNPHEPLLTFNPPTLKETNPLLWALLAEVRSRLAQMAAGLNFLGYREDYVSPWRFQFLLERARYFAEHAKSVQRDYLNFLASAEREDQQEASAAQAIALEKANIRIEDARVEQSRLESEAANASKGLADLNVRLASDRFRNYASFASRMRDLADEIGQYRYLSIGSSTLMGVTNEFAAFFGALSIHANIQITDLEKFQAGEQRALEKLNLQDGIGEAEGAANVAAAQLEVAKQGFVVAGLQRAAATLRHDHAVEVLTFLRERSLNAEQWYRLSQLVKDVGLWYLRHANELAFLAEQAYEFEADRQINVIRFDYDSAETGDLLGADFLLRDLDTLEADLVTAQDQREQHVRYVVSLARDFPDVLAQLRQNATALLRIPLRALETRFPGLYSLRVGTVEMLPLALMDAARWSLAMTYTGASQVRLRGPAPTAANTVTSWIPEADAHWPVRVRLSSPTTAVFSGLTRNDEQTSFPVTFANQRSAFEGFGAAGTFHLNVALGDGQIDPASLADVLLTFHLSAYHDPALAPVIEAGAAGRPRAVTQHLSAAELLPDAFFDFVERGVLEVDLEDRMLAPTGRPGLLRNVGVALIPAEDAPPVNALAARHELAFRVTDDLRLESGGELPLLSFSANGLAMTLSSDVAGAAELRWDFGDRSSPVTGQLGTPVTHTYALPGRYVVLLDVIRGEQLTRIQTEVSISARHGLAAPVTAIPRLSSQPGPPGAGTLRVQASTQGIGTPAEAVSWALAGVREVRRGPGAQWELPPGAYALRFTAARPLNGRLYCAQRFLPDAAVAIEDLRAATNREFDADGNEQNAAARNALAVQMFGSGPLMARDRWTFALPLADNPSLRGATLDDAERPLLHAAQDVVLALEYDVDR
jgi:hypothetical protein